MLQSVSLLQVKDPLFKRMGASRLAHFAIDGNVWSNSKLFSNELLIYCHASIACLVPVNDLDGGQTSSSTYTPLRHLLFDFLDPSCQKFRSRFSSDGLLPYIKVFMLLDKLS
mgnify:FL=1